MEITEELMVGFYKLLGFVYAHDPPEKLTPKTTSTDWCKLIRTICHNFNWFEYERNGLSVFLQFYGFSQGVIRIFLNSYETKLK